MENYFRLNSLKSFFESYTLSNTVLDNVFILDIFYGQAMYIESNDVVVLGIKLAWGMRENVQSYLNNLLFS